MFWFRPDTLPLIRVAAVIAPSVFNVCMLVVSAGTGVHRPHAVVHG
jgi:hypothetical protein